MNTDIPPPAGALWWLARWLRYGFVRPSDMMIMPEPKVLTAWRSLLGLPPRDRR